MYKLYIIYNFNERNFPFRIVVNRSFLTFIATGYIVPPTSKLPFLNIMTDVLLIHVPTKKQKHPVFLMHTFLLRVRDLLRVIKYARF